eukprot:scaffold98_cov244-Pinguiococcus_pyrenoidosus.AAC.14
MAGNCGASLDPPHARMHRHPVLVDPATRVSTLGTFLRTEGRHRLLLDYQLKRGEVYSSADAATASATTAQVTAKTARNSAKVRSIIRVDLACAATR